MPKGVKEQYSLYIPPMLAKKLDIIAEVDEQTRSEAIIEMLREMIDEHMDMDAYMSEFADLEDEDEDDDEEEETAE